MKKILRAIILLTICCSMLITSGCASDTRSNSSTVSDPDTGSESSDISESAPDEGFELVPISEIRERFEKDAENIKNKEYDNLNFDKAVFSPPPQIDSISELKLVRLAGKSTDEVYDFFCKTVDTLTDNKYTDEEKRYEIRFADIGRDENRPDSYTLPNIDEYKDGKETDDPWAVIDNKDYFIWLGGGVLLKFNNGDLLDHEGVERVHLEGNYSMLSHRHVLYTEDLTSTDTYRLVDGEISIADAAKFAQNYLDDLVYTPYADANLTKPRIYAVNVFDIGEGCYGYDFMITYEYNGVWFDRYESKQGGRVMYGYETDYDKRKYGSWMGCIDMIRTDKIHCFADICKVYGVVEGEPTTEIITVGSAADAVSEFYSSFMNFTITEVSMVWLDTREWDAAVQEAYPCWKFKMYANGVIYHTFVDVITGEIHLYGQVV